MPSRPAPLIIAEMAASVGGRRSAARGAEAMMEDGMQDASPDGGSPTDLSRTLQRLEAARTDAWLKRDGAALAALLDDDFIEINVLGRLTRATVLGDLFPRLTLVSLDGSDFRVVPVGEGAAVLTYACSETVRVDGREISGRFHVASLWRRRPDGWRLALWQITPVADDG